MSKENNDNSNVSKNLNTNSNKTEKKDEEIKEQPKQVADEADIDILKKYGKGPYSEKIRNIEDEVKNFAKDVNKLCGIRESDTGLSLPSNWVAEVSIRKFFIEK
jgi:26S proteasome regulatory subunit T1